jgi:plasmid stabilization system protein ParE
MKPVYSRRALADLEEIANYYSTNASPAIADSIERRFRELLNAFAGYRTQLRAYRSALTCGSFQSSAIRSGFSIVFAATWSTSCISVIRRVARSCDCFRRTAASSSRALTASFSCRFYLSAVQKRIPPPAPGLGKNTIRFHCAHEIFLFSRLRCGRGSCVVTCLKRNQQNAWK